MSYTKKVAFNTAAQMIGKVVGTGISLATVAILFRTFGVEGIGRYTTIFAFVAFFAVFADFGFQWTLMRELSVDKDHDKVFPNIFTLRLLLAIVIHGLAFALVWFFNYPLQVKIGVGVITFAQFFLTVNSTLVGVFLTNYRLDITVTAEVIGRAIILALIWLLARSGMSLGYVLLAYLVGNFINFFINVYFVRRFVKFKFAFNAKYWRYAAAQAFPIGIVLVFGFVYYKVDSIMLSVMKGMTDVGIYGTAYKLLEVLQMVPSMFLGAAFPLITGYIALKDPRIKTAFQKEFDFLVILAVPIVVGVYMLAAPIISFIAGGRTGEFLTASTVTFMGHAITSVTCLRILILSVGISFITNLYAYMVVSLGRQKNMVWPTIGLALFNVVLNLILIPKYSYLGSAVATLLTEVLVLTANYTIAKGGMRLSIKLGNGFKVIAAGVLMGLAILYLSKINANLFVEIAGAAVIYVLLLFVFRAIPLGMIRDTLRRRE